MQRRGGGYTCREQDKPGYLIFNIFVEKGGELEDIPVENKDKPGYLIFNIFVEKGGELEDIPVENKDKPGSKIRQIVLLLFILFSLAVSISLIVAIFKFD